MGGTTKYLTSNQFYECFGHHYQMNRTRYAMVSRDIGLGFIMGDVFCSDGKDRWRAMTSRCMENAGPLPYPDEFRVITETELVKEINNKYERA